MSQLTLFAPQPTLHSPLCIYDPHCGHRAVLGPPIDRPHCTNREITCLQCQRTGIQSTRKEGA